MCDTVITEILPRNVKDNMNKHNSIKRQISYASVRGKAHEMPKVS